jgi:hypothetical protein
MFLFRFVFVVFVLTGGLLAQSVQPVIVEYKGKADGKIALTNNTDLPMVVVLEPKSFSITPEGKGLFRDLDSSIHVELSSMSVRLQPRQTYYVFYKATADKLPAWFTLYATFSSPKHSEGLDVRLMLPHTVYLYQKQSIAENKVVVKSLFYDAETRKLTCDIENNSDALTRIQSVRATGSHVSDDLSGFPLLPGSSRHIAMSWKDSSPPTQISFHFEHFDLKRSVASAAN